MLVLVNNYEYALVRMCALFHMYALFDPTFAFFLIIYSINGRADIHIQGFKTSLHSSNLVTADV